MTLVLASLIFILCQFVKALRIYFVLGEYRIKFISLFLLNNIAVFCSYLMGGGLVLIYEIIVIFFLYLFKLPLLSSCYTLLVLRLFDSIIISVVIPLLGISVSNKFYLLICFFAITSWLMVSTLPVILNRLEKRILISDFPPKVSLQCLKQLVIFEKQINLLSFFRRGSVSMLIMLTFLIWGLESLSLATLYGNFWSGADAVFSRVAGSLGIVHVRSFNEYNILIYIMIAITFLVFAFSLCKSILENRK